MKPFGFHPSDATCNCTQCSSLRDLSGPLVWSRYLFWRKGGYRARLLEQRLLDAFYKNQCPHGQADSHSVFGQDRGKLSPLVNWRVGGGFGYKSTPRPVFVGDSLITESSRLSNACCRSSSQTELVWNKEGTLLGCSVVSQLPVLLKDHWTLCLCVFLAWVFRQQGSSHKCLMANVPYATRAKALPQQFIEVQWRLMLRFQVSPSVAICFGHLLMITKCSMPQCNGSAVSSLA